MSPSRKSARGRSFGLRFLIRLIGWSFSAAIAFVVLAYVASPVLIRYGLPHALARYGVVSSMEGARVSLTDERVTLVGFQLGQTGGPAIRWGELEARVDTAELLKGNIRIIDFQVKDARVDLAQLRASKWNPPESAAAFPELEKLNIDIGNAVLRDLEFIGLSERIGRKVGLRSLSVGSLSNLEAGARVAFQLEGYVGDGSLRLAGRARIANSLPVFDGRYEVDPLELRGLGRLLGLATPSSVGGKFGGNGTFELAYLQGDGEVHAKLSGNARVDGLEIDAGDTRIIDTDAEWNGDAEIFWQVLGGLPRVIARGSVASPALQAAWRETAGPNGILLRGFRWNGELRHGGELETEGEFSSDMLRVDASSEETPRIAVELSRLSGESSFRSGRRGYEFETGELIAESARLTQGLGSGRQSITAYRMLLEKVRLGTKGHRIGSLKAESAEATFAGVADKEPSGSAGFISIDAKGIEIHADRGALIDQLDVEHAGLDFQQLSLDLSQARARRVQLGTNTPFEAEAVSTSSLRQKTGVLEIWGSNLQLSGTGVSATGEVFSDEAAAESLSQTISGDPVWEASAVRAARLSIGTRQIEASELGTERFTYGKFGGTLIEIDGGDGADFSIRYGSGIDAGSLDLVSLSFRSGQFTTVELTSAKLKAPGVGFQGQLSAKSIDAGGVRYGDGGANTYWLEMVKLGELSGSLSNGLHIDAAHAGLLSHDRAAGTDYRARGLDLSRVAFSRVGEVSAIAARLDSLEFALDDGARLNFEDAAAAYPAASAGGRFSAESGSIRSLVYSMPGERILELFDIEVEAVDNDENEAHRIHSVSAAGARASDPSVKGELEVGALEIAAISISAEATLRADLARANAVSLVGYDGSPSPAFSSDRVDVNKLVLEAGERLRLGEVLLDNPLLTIGVDDQKEFALPEPPFFSGDRESFGSLTIERLETRQPARLAFFDQSTSPPFEAVISSLQARLENFRGGVPGQRAKFALDGRIGEFSNLQTAGEFSVERDGLSLEMGGEVSAIELNRLNTYLARQARRAVRSGQGGAAFDIAVRGRRLSGEVRFVFTQVDFQRAGARATAEGREEKGLTFEDSIAMLEDKEGVVRLNVSLSGSLDDPSFSISDVLLQALSKTVRSAVMLTFRPLGLPAGAAGLAADSASLELGPVAFEGGEHELSAEGLAHLDALAGELQQHPAVALRVCGRAVSADRIRMEQRDGESTDGMPPTNPGINQAADMDVLLHNLAQQRASAVRRYLQEIKQISQHRLLDCEATVESTLGRLPRVDLPLHVETGSNSARSEASPG